MSAQDYRAIWQQVQQLTLGEQFQLLGDLRRLLSPQTTVKPLHSILELEGLGKKIWEDIDVAQYLEQERDSWDHPLS